MSIRSCEGGVPFHDECLVRFKGRVHLRPGGCPVFLADGASVVPSTAGCVVRGGTRATHSAVVVVILWVARRGPTGPRGGTAGFRRMRCNFTSLADERLTNGCNDL